MAINLIRISKSVSGMLRNQFSLLGLPFAIFILLLTTTLRAEPRVEPPTATPSPTPATAEQNNALAQQAQTYEQNGDLRNAALSVRKLYDRAPSAEHLRWLLRLYRLLGDVAAVDQLLKHYAALVPSPSPGLAHELQEFRRWVGEQLAQRSDSMSRTGARTKPRLQRESGEVRSVGTVPPSLTNLTQPLGPTTPGVRDSSASPVARRMPAWGWALLTGALGTVATGVTIGLIVHYNPIRDYVIYPSEVK